MSPSPRRGLRLARLFGIDIQLDPSVLFIFALVVFSLGSGLLPHWHPEWSGTLVWGTAFVAGILLFVSLLAHEMAHSIVAKLHGIEVPRITLFLFGGVSEMEREPETPGSEFLIAVVGPLMSLFLGIAFSFLGALLASPEFTNRLSTDPEGAMAALDPVATLLFWLGPVNLLLGVFNLVPGFPLDGGRVLRAVLWWTTGSLELATRWAARAGVLFAYLLLVLGVSRLLGGLVLEGLWLLVIGWFLQNASRASHTHLWLKNALANLRVTDLMRTHFETVAADAPIATFVEEGLLRSGQQVWPVVRGDQVVGTITFDAVAGLSSESWPTERVADVMTALDESECVPSSLSGKEAFETLAKGEVDPLLVVDDGHVHGILYRADIFRWLAAHHLQPPGL